MQAATVTDDRLLSKEDLARQFNIPASDATLSRYRRFKGMPEPIRITNGTVRWRASQIRAWIDSIAAAQAEAQQADAQQVPARPPMPEITRPPQRRRGRPARQLSDGGEGEEDGEQQFVAERIAESQAQGSIS
jgi:predicted DNA-binding transcriptional regulator AlpA